MKNSEKIWNLLQSPNTFEMGMELLETLGPFYPNIPYELFTRHNALQWFQGELEEKYDDRFSQLIIDCFAWIASSDDIAHQTYLNNEFMVYLDSYTKLSTEHVDTFNKMVNLTVNVHWREWPSVIENLSSKVELNRLRVDCRDCIVYIGSLLKNLSCNHIIVYNVPDTIEVVSDVLEHQPQLKTLDCQIGEGLLIWLSQNKTCEHSIQRITTMVDQLIFSDAAGTLQERVEEIETAVYVSEREEYNVLNYPNVHTLRVGDVLGDVVSFVLEHASLQTTIQQLHLREQNSSVPPVALRYGISVSPKIACELNDDYLLKILLYARLPIDQSVQDRLDWSSLMGARLQKCFDRYWLRPELNAYNLKTLLNLVVQQKWSEWEPVQWITLYHQMLFLLQADPELMVEVHQQLEDILQRSERYLYLDGLDILQDFEAIGVQVKERMGDQDLMDALIAEYFPTGVDFSDKDWSPDPNHVKSYQRWLDIWIDLTVQEQAIPSLQKIEDMKLSKAVLDGVVTQQFDRLERSQAMTEWMVIRIREIFSRQECTLQEMRSLLDRSLCGVKILSLDKIGLTNWDVPKEHSEALLSCMYTHKVLCSPTDFQYVVHVEDGYGGSKEYGDWVVLQFDQLGSLDSHHIRPIVSRLLKLDNLEGRSFEERVQFLQQHFPSTTHTQWLYEPWGSEWSLKRFSGMVGGLVPVIEDWLIQGVTNLFERQSYVQATLAKHLFRKVESGDMSQTELQRLLVTQFVQGRKLVRYQLVPQKLYDTLLRGLYENPDKLSTAPGKIKALIYVLPSIITKHQQAASLKSILLGFRSLFKQKKSLVSKVILYIDHWKSTGVLTIAEYDAFLLVNFEHGFVLSSSVPQHMYEDLFNTLVRSEVDIAFANIPVLYQVAGKFNLDVSQFDAILIQYREIFGFHSPLTMVERVLELVSEGILSQSEYYAYLLANFEYCFRTYSWTSSPKKLYWDLFAALNSSAVTIPIGKIPELYQIAEQHSLDTTRLEQAILDIRDLFGTDTSQVVTNHVLEFVSEGVLNRKDYHAYLIENFNNTFNFYSWKNIPKRLYQDLFEALTEASVDISIVKIEQFYTIAEHYELTLPNFDDAILKTRSLFGLTTPKSMIRRVLEFVSEGVLSQLEYDKFLLLNFKRRFDVASSVAAISPPRELYANLLEAIRSVDIDIEPSKLTSLFKISGQHDLDMSLFDKYILRRRDLFNGSRSQYWVSRVLEFVSEGVLSQSEYEDFLLKNFNAQYFYADSTIPKQLYQDLFAVLKDASLKLSDDTLKHLYKVAQQHDFDTSRFTMRLLKSRNIFDWDAPPNMSGHLLTLCLDGELSREEYQLLLLLNFKCVFYGSSTIPKQLYQDLFEVLKEDSVVISDHHLKKLYTVAGQHELDASHFQCRVLKMNELFHSDTPENMYDRVLDFVSEGVLSQSEYEDFLLRNFEHRFTYVYSTPKKLYEDLFESLKDSSVEITRTKIVCLYKVMNQYSAEFSGFTFDHALLNMVDLFTHNVPLNMYDRVLRFVSEGALSQSEYEDFLLRNFEHRFTYVYSTPKKLYEDLFESLKDSSMKIGNGDIKSLYKVASRYSIDCALLNTVVLNSTQLFKGAIPKIMLNHIRSLIPNQVLSQSEYDVFLLKNFEHCFTHVISTPKELYTDLFAALNRVSVEIADPKLKELFEVALGHQIDVSFLSPALVKLTTLFHSYTPENMYDRVLRFVSEGVLSQSEYEDFLLKNFRTHFSFTSTDLSGSLYKDLFAVLKDTSAVIELENLTGLYLAAEEYNLEMSFFDDVLLKCQSIFDGDTPKVMGERILTLRKDGVLSQSDYEFLLRTNFKNGLNINTRLPSKIYEDLFEVLLSIETFDVHVIPIVVHIQDQLDLNVAVFQHAFRCTNNLFDAPFPHYFDMEIEYWIIDGRLMQEDLDVCLLNSIENVQYRSDIPKEWYQRAIELTPPDDHRTLSEEHSFEWLQVASRYQLIHPYLDRMIGEISSRDSLSRAWKEIVPEYILYRVSTGARIDFQAEVWFFCVRPTMEQVKWMIELYQEGKTLFPTPHILQHMVHQIPKTPEGTAYLQACVTYWCKQTGKAWFEAWPVDKILLALPAVPDDIRRLDLVRTTLETFPEECKRFKDLEKLFVYNTALPELPSEILQLSKLEVVSISNTDLDIGPLLQLPVLKKLYCKGISLSSDVQTLFNVSGIELRR